MEMKVNSLMTQPENISAWTAEDFERYGEKLAVEAELAAKVEMAKEEASIKAEEKRKEEQLENQHYIDLAAETLAKRQKETLNKESGRIRAKYGEQLTDDEVIAILNVEQEMSQCKGCLGKTCKKFYNRNYCKAIEYNEKRGLKINSYYCPKMTQAKYKLSKIPLAYIGKTFESYKVDEVNELAVRVAKKLLEQPDAGAYFYGGVGTGKTLLATIIANELIRRGREVIFATVPTISARIRSTFNQKKTTLSETDISETDILEKLYTVPTLILDDIGMEKPTRFVCSTLCNIFNERYNAQLQTIMTSNYRLEELENIFNNPIDSREKTLDGTRILDRCKQMCFPVELKGKSRRG